MDRPHPTSLSLPRVPGVGVSRPRDVVWMLVRRRGAVGKSSGNMHSREHEGFTGTTHEVVVARGGQGSSWRTYIPVPHVVQGRRED